MGLARGLATVFLGFVPALVLSACGDSPDKALDRTSFDYVHEVSDLPVDPNIEYGKLENGLRFAVRSNSTPTSTAS